MSADPLVTLWGAIAGDGRGELLVEHEVPDAERVARVRRAHATTDRDGWLEDVRRRSRLVEPEVLCVPHEAWPSVLWAVVDTGAQAKALERFEPAPTLVLREGSTVRRTALWALERGVPEPVQGEGWAVRGCRRIAHALGTQKKHARGWGIWIRPPGSMVRRGPRPLEVVVERHDVDAVYGVRDVIGRLPDAPDPEAWKRAQT